MRFIILFQKNECVTNDINISLSAPKILKISLRPGLAPTVNLYALLICTIAIFAIELQLLLALQLAN